MSRVLHTGDTHLGYQQYHSDVRRDDFLAAFASVLEDAIEDDVDAVVHAGDLFHSRRPDLQDLVGTIEALSKLRGADIPFYAIVGNHEGTRSAQWLDLFESLDLATRLGTEPVVVGDIALYGLDYLPAAQRGPDAYSFAPIDAAFHCLVSHGAFSPFPYGNWDLKSILETSPVEFDAVLLGDNHEPLRREVRGVPAMYCGSTERVSADERDARGYNLVTANGELQITRRGVETRRFVYVDVELAESEGTDRIRERLQEEDLKDAVVIVTIEGTGDRVIPADIETVADEQGALVTRVNDRREVDSESEFDVQFADPDAAVRERIRNLGLSTAARSIDDVIRSGSVADSNVGEVVEDRVREVIDDPSAFETMSEDTEDDTHATGREQAEDDGGDDERGHPSEDGDGQSTMEEYL